MSTSNDGKIDSSGRGPLGWGEQQALAMQAKNRRLSDGMRPGEFEADNLRSIATTSGGLKTPRFSKY
jgi:hypothetical protein